jgi:hypothetical protein
MGDALCSPVCKIGYITDRQAQALSCNNNDNDDDDNELHYSPDGHKPPLIRFHSLIFSANEEQVANLLPQHLFESA